MVRKYVNFGNIDTSVLYVSVNTLINLSFLQKEFLGNMTRGGTAYSRRTEWTLEGKDFGSLSVARRSIFNS